MCRVGLLCSRRAVSAGPTHCCLSIASRHCVYVLALVNAPVKARAGQELRPAGTRAEGLALPGVRDIVLRDGSDILGTSLTLELCGEGYSNGWSLPYGLGTLWLRCFWGHVRDMSSCVQACYYSGVLCQLSVAEMTP